MQITSLGLVGQLSGEAGSEDGVNDVSLMFLAAYRAQVIHMMYMMRHMIYMLTTTMR